MKILLDTNIILDHLLNRKPFNKPAEWIFAMTETGSLESYIGATTVTTMHYLLEKNLNRAAAKNYLNLLLKLFDIAPVNRMILESALGLNFTDYEDAVLHEAGIHCGVDAIITRDEKGFIKAKLPIYSPQELKAMLRAVEIQL